MSQSELFLAQLDEALTSRAVYLAKQEIPVLKEACRTVQAAFTGIYKVLLEKGQIQEDQYQYEQKISDLKPPSSDPFSESDMYDQMNYRMAAFAGQLDFLNNFFFLSPETLTLKTIKSILSLLDYIHWHELSATSAHVMTRSLTLYLEKIKQGGDAMAINIMANSVKVLRDQQKSIKAMLKKISVYSRQNYKLMARMNVLAKMTLDPHRIQVDRQGTLQAIKFEFPVNWEGAPFYRELIEEILEEDYTPGGDALQKKILKSLEVKQKVVRKKKKNIDAELKQQLLSLVNEIAKAYIPLETIISRLDENSRLMDENLTTFAQKFNRWFNRVMRHKTEIHYEVNVSQLGKGKKKEKVNFTSYMNWLRMKANFYKSLNNPTGSSYTRAADSTPKQLEDFIDKNQQELKKILNRLTVLEGFFKEEAGPEIKSKVRGYKAELSQLKNIIGKILTGLKEYQVKVEEMEQMKNLGIDPNAE